MAGLKPWTYGPFELILHAELHRLQGDDFDRRIALIGFDNSVEVSITTYLTLNPIQRGGREYTRTDVYNWLSNYHSKLEFYFETELQQRSISPKVDKGDIIWYHSIRNDQYHGGSQSIPEVRALEGIREAALWVFSVLFDIPDIETILRTQIDQELQSGTKPEREPALDRVIDVVYGMVEVAGQTYYTSELLFGVDHVAYRELGEGLSSDATTEDAGETTE